MTRKTASYLTFLFVCFSLLSHLFAADVEKDDFWRLDYEGAKKEAEKEGKNLFVVFTGSDWSGWCGMLYLEIFDKEEFRTVLLTEYIPVKVDFPRDPESLGKEQKAHNDALKERFAVRGYPTVLLVDSDSRPFAKLSYLEGGPEAYTRLLNMHGRSQARRKDMFASAENFEGAKKARALLSGIETIQKELHDFYTDYDKAAKEADEKTYRAHKQKAALSATWKDTQASLMALFKAQDYGSVILKIDAFILEHEPEGEFRQNVLMPKLYSFAQMKRYDDALALTDEIAQIDPSSRVAQQMDWAKKQIHSMQSAPSENQKTKASPKSVTPEKPKRRRDPEIKNL